MSKMPMYKVGQILVKRWSKAKQAKNLVAKVTKIVPLNGTYKYEIQLPNNSKETISLFPYTSLDLRRERLNNDIQRMYRLVTRLEQELADTYKIEEEAKKLLK